MSTSIHENFAIHAIRQSEDSGTHYTPDMSGQDADAVKAALYKHADKVFSGWAGMWYEGVSAAGAKHPRWTVLIPS